ncbi:glycosyltransferase [Cryobacterium arcticum]|uniref:Glycosyl transferase family 2 n=1 Tax=Cryobacterium arcticum TaxID=670052 RepID=A0A1B1BQ73_9MICO|nr:glycosyltransferase [Cryobacterium arcticum]ANP74779.1 Glycosyl transferase family 2 [Cryobacterium arcticum]
MDVTIIIPTFNEAPNIEILVDRIVAVMNSGGVEVVFVDDSTDNTPDIIRQVAARSTIPVRLIHRDDPVGGLSGAVREGISSSTGTWCVVMDGDLQHPPELIPVLLASGAEQHADIVVASRHLHGGSSTGLDNRLRRFISNGSILLTRAMFPIKLRNVTDPMTGFFALRRDSVDLAGLRPRGFKILLEILARGSLVIVEEPFVFGKRVAGSSKADLRQGLRFVTQLGALRFGRLSGFAAVGAIGAIANVAIMAGLQAVGVWYLTAALAAALVTIVGNFVLLEHFVFHDLREGGRSGWIRFAQSFVFNGSETALRTTALWLLVESLPVSSLLAQALLLAVGFVVRFVYHSRVVYRPSRSTSPHPSVSLIALDGMAQER